ncbi:MAG: TonB-dependent receptor [Bacteroidia bacterium]|nr:TonB-dependent receptor [Bacteroidia bacterium]
MRTRLLFSFFLLLSCLAFARTNRTVSGILHGSDRQPLAYATVMLLNAADSSLVKGAITDEQGAYRFDDLQPGRYRVKATQVGLETTFSTEFDVTEAGSDHPLPTLVMGGKSVQLKEATVSGEKPFLEHRVDKIVVNVENSIVNAGGTALEILQKSPGVTVDNNGNIFLRGKQGVLVMMDGKPTYLSAQELYNMLRNMPADQLAQIEIITNPSAKYDAAGTTGIVNIRMRKNRNYGTNGDLRTSYGQGRYLDYGFGGSVNHRNKLFNAYGSYDYGNGFYFESTEMQRRFRDGNFVSTFKQDNYDKGEYINHNFRSGLDVSLSPKHTIGFLVRGTYNTGENHNRSVTDILNASDIPDSGYVTRNDNNSEWNNLNGNFNYRWAIDSAGQELSIDADLGRFDNKADFNFYTDHYDYLNRSNDWVERSYNRQPAVIDIRTAKADYVKPIGKKSRFEAGAKISDVETDSDVRFFNIINGADVADTGKTNHFVYEETIRAGYVNGTTEFGKIGLQLGLRAEQTIAKGTQQVNNSTFTRDYTQLFPTAFLTYSFNDTHQVHVSYGRRIDRPAYQQLNPFKFYLDPYTYQEGNPLLQPQLTNAYEIGYTFLQRYSINLNFSRTNNAMTQITRQIDSLRTTYIITENLQTNDNLSVNLNLPFQPFPWWEMNNNLTVYNTRFKGPSSAGEVDVQRTAVSFNTNHAIRLPKEWALEVNGYFNSASVWGTWIVRPFGSMSMGFRKQLLDGKVTLRINVNDPFWTDRIRSTVRMENIDAQFNRFYDSRFVRFHVSWKFGKQTVAGNRQRRTGAEEEQNRIQRR